MTEATRQVIDRAKRFAEVVRADDVQLPTGSDSAEKLAYAEAIVELTAEAGRLTFALHQRRAHPDFEYATTQTARKSGDDPRIGLEGDGWEPNDIVENHEYLDGGVVNEHWRNWERYQFHEDNFWRRRTTKDTP